MVQVFRVKENVGFDYNCLYTFEDDWKWGYIYIFYNFEGDGTELVIVGMTGSE